MPIAGKVAGKVLPAVIGGVAGGAVKGGITAAATIAGSTIEAVGSTLGGALQGLLTQPDQTNISVTYSGMGMSSNKSAPSRVPDPKPGKNPKAASLNTSMSIEQLLNVAVEYLSSIDTTIKNQNIAAQQALRIKAADEREQKIETPFGLGNEIDTKKIDGEKQETSPSVLKTLAIGALGAAGILAALEALKDDNDKSAFSRLFNKVIDNIEWLFLGGWGLGLIKNLAGAPSKTAATRILVSTLGSPITWAIAAAVGTIYGVDKGTSGKAWDESKESLDYLEKNYGMKRNIGRDSYTINGKEYSARDLPKEYQTLLDAYGPLGDGRSKRSKDARDRIEKTEKEKYDKLRINQQNNTKAGDNFDSSAYNAVYGNGKYGRPNKNLTDMTIGEVVDYQTRFHKNGGGRSPNTPMGAYQINKATLLEHAPKALGPNWKEEKFTPENQEKIAKRIYEKQGFGAWEAPKKKGIADPGSWDKAKPIIVNTETGGKATPGSVESTEPDGGPTNNVQETFMDVVKKGFEVLRYIGKVDSEYKPLGGSETDFAKYRELYKKNLEADVDAVAGRKKDVPRVEITTADALRNINNGTLDVINPNYNMSDGDILIQYISFFGYER